MYYPELKGSCSSKFLSHAKLHNKALSNALKKLSNKLPGFKYSILDYYYALGDRINNATKYGTLLSLKPMVLSCQHTP